MNSAERKEQRYLRRVASREARKAKIAATADKYDITFSYGNLYKSYKKCRRGVSWKTPVKKYISDAPVKTQQSYKKLKNRKFRSTGFIEFDVNERGKTRHIKAVKIAERIVQKCLCDNSLVPMLRRSFIYDNSATLKKRGYHFAIRRCCQHLREFYRKYGANGYALVYDFSKFFDKVSHELCNGILNKTYTDKDIIELTEHFIKCFGYIGLGLGSPISQIFALAAANPIDHYVKEVLRVRGYGRYMDDGYLIHQDKQFLKRCLTEIRELCQKLGITINEKKTKIVKLTHGFTFLKAKITLLESGEVLKRIPHDSVRRERVKLKKYARFVETGEMTIKKVKQAFQSWRSYANNFKSHRTVRNMELLFESLFINDKTEKANDNAIAA